LKQKSICYQLGLLGYLRAMDWSG